jgi:hypothetical protein
MSFFLGFSACYFSLAYFHQSSKMICFFNVKILSKSSFLNFVCFLIEGSGSVQIITNLGGSNTYGSYGIGSGTLLSTIIRDLLLRDTYTYIYYEA